MAPLLNQQIKAFVGIDRADTKHDICLQPAGEGRREFDCIPHQVARIDESVAALHKRFDGPSLSLSSYPEVQSSLLYRSMRS